MGYWIVEDHGFCGQYYRCSNCRNVWIDTYESIPEDTCPKCGIHIDKDKTKYIDKPKKHKVAKNIIVIETKLKKIPEKCNKCKYSYANGGYGCDSERFCSVSFEKGMCRPCPIEFVKEKRNWEYQRPDWCPLREVEV